MKIVLLLRSFVKEFEISDCEEKIEYRISKGSLVPHIHQASHVFRNRLSESSGSHESFEPWLTSN